MGFINHAILLSVALIISFSFSFLVSALDTITESQPIKEPKTLSSNNNMFTLGFFSPQNSTNRYVGIWYISKSAVVWIANRNQPLRDFSGVVTVSENGNLEVLNAQKHVVWSTNMSLPNMVASNVSARLLDSGNLVLLDNTTGRTVWESFQHPCDTAIPTLKVSKNVRTGEEVRITSWKSLSDPSYGSFSLGLETGYVTELFIWNGTRPFWRSGPWNGHVFIGTPNMISLFRDGVSLEETDGTFYYSYDYANKSFLRIYVLNPQGLVERRHWDYGNKEWEVKGTIQESECDVYGMCGPFGMCNSKSSPICTCLRGFEPRNKGEWDRQNWTSGCVRREALQCERVKNGSKDGTQDGFLKLQMAKVPDLAGWSPSKDGSPSGYGDCRSLCLSNCSCIAFAYEAGVGCMFWSTVLHDIQTFSYGGVDLYIRLAYSELCTNFLLGFFWWKIFAVYSTYCLSGKVRNTRTIIIITVITGTILIVTSAYILWRRVAKQAGFRNAVALIYGTYNSIIHFDTGVTGMHVHNESRFEELKRIRIHDLPLFDFRKLADATNNFHSQNKLGQGGFGPVYKGKLEDEQEIAVKRLATASGQGMQEFLNEVEVISKLQHRNLVRLLGCCIEAEEKMRNIGKGKPNCGGSATFLTDLNVISHNVSLTFLKFIFADPLKQKLLDWEKRFNIIEGIARGLLYLHRDSRLRIIHRDLKPSNILLDEELNSKISDFGMAKIFGDSEVRGKTKKIVGTYGYISPEYAMQGIVCEQSDVFSFGVLLLEIVSGRRNTSIYEDEESLTLIGFAWKSWNNNNITSLVDPQIYDPRFYKDMLRCVHIGLMCVQELVRDRPIMATVISMLHSEIVDIPPPKQPAFVHSQTLSGTLMPTQKDHELFSINNGDRRMVIKFLFEYRKLSFSFSKSKCESTGASASYHDVTRHVKNLLSSTEEPVSSNPNSVKIKGVAFSPMYWNEKKA
ncbi:G-type lectin S-receptor-like serine/threonine-protein kinase, partial [Mucuna pruriens]